MEAPEAISANAGYHAYLLELINGLEYVPAARKHQTSYVKDLEAQLTQSQKKITVLAEKTKKERKEHETLRDSTARRFAHKMLGKREQYEAKESKEEREYVEALEKEMTERDNQNVITQLLDDAKVELENLTDKEKRFKGAQDELRALYGRIFDGPTAAFPEDDRLEYDVNESVRKYEQIQMALNGESQAAELLARASRTMDGCSRNMSEALSYSRYDIWGGGNLSDMMERSALRNAQAQASQVEMLVAQAMRASPQVQPVGAVTIAQGSLVSDVFFDNIFSDMAFHNKIKQSAAQVLRAGERLKAERDAARRRADAAGAELIQIATILEQRRQELDSFRQATFESYLAEHPPPPGYDIATSGKHIPTAPPSFPTPERTSNDTAPGPGGSTPSPTPAAPPQEQRIQWGKRNPYAAAMAERTRSLSQD